VVALDHKNFVPSRLDAPHHQSREI